MSRHAAPASARSRHDQADRIRREPDRLPLRIRLDRWAIWLVFVAAHVIGYWVSTYHYSKPFTDVTGVYRMWMDQAHSGSIPGIDQPFVYPVGALVPMWLTDFIGGHDSYGQAWTALVLLLNCWAMSRLTERPVDADAPLRRLAAWFWSIFLLCLGVIGIGRIDAITVPVAIVGLLELRHHPRVAGMLFTAGAWIKVWPAALFAAALVSARRWRPLVIGAATVCGIVLVGVLIAGGGGAIPNALSFITEQTGRGLQLESVASSLFLVGHLLGIGGYQVGYSTEILTQQLTGPGVETAIDLLTPLMFVAVVALLGLGWLARRRGMGLAQRFPALALGLVCAFFVFNKVGSPQFMTWLAPVIIIGLIWDGRAFQRLALVALAIALLTNLIYPWYYFELVNVDVNGILALVARNLLVVGLLAWSVMRLIGGLRRRAAEPAASDPVPTQTAEVTS